MDNGNRTLRLGWSAEDIKAVKMAAIERGFPTVSAILLQCFREYVKAHPYGEEQRSDERFGPLLTAEEILNGRI